MLERIGAVSMILGSILGVVGCMWLMIRIIRGYFSKAPWSRLKGPLLLILFSAMLAGLPLALNSAMTHFVSLGPLETMVSGERHLTLTGWDQKDYSVITKCENAIVLQMANSDVTDETLAFLSGLTQLRELDLSNTQVTDAGLATIAKLPNLRDLRLARTSITDEGFRTHLYEKKDLMNLDLTGTAIASKTVRAWKAANPDRKAIR